MGKWGVGGKGGVHGKGGHAWQREGGMRGRGYVWRRGACVVKRGACMAKRGACMAGDMATAADGTHPTGMHSCYRCFSVQGVGEAGVHMMSLPVWLPGPMFLPGGSASRGVCLRGWSVSIGSAYRGRMGVAVPPHQKSRRYTSYWNILLFCKIFPIN